MPGFLAELKHRRVTRVLIGYLVGAWVVIEVTSTVFPLMGLPLWAPRLVLGLLVVGLPLALVLAWFFDWDPGQGIRRAGDAAEAVRPAPALASRAGPALAALLIAGTVAFGAARLWAPGEKLPPRVLVTVFENRTGDPAMSQLGHMVADWVTQGLIEADFVEVADPQTAFRAAQRSGLATADIASTAPIASTGEAGAGLVVSGSYYRSGDSLLINAEIRDISAGRVIAALPATKGAFGEPLRAVEELRQRVLAALAQHLDEAVGSWEGSAGRPPSYEAYRLYVEGLQAWLATEQSDARELFEGAVARDSTFDRARIWAALAQLLVGNDSVTDSHLRILQSRRSQLSEYDRARFEFVRAFWQDDFDVIHEAARRVRSAAPGSLEAARELALASIRTRRYDEARAIFDGADTRPGFLRLWVPDYYYYHAHLLHLQGEYTREAEVTEEAEAAGAIERPAAQLRRAVAAAGAGRAADAIAFARAASLGNGMEELIVGRELIGHGHAAAGRQLLSEAVVFLERSAATDPSLRGPLGLGYYALGRYAEAASALEAASSSGSATFDRLYYRAHLARIAARDGDTVRARLLSSDERVDYWWHRNFLEAMAGGAVAAIRGDARGATDLIASFSDFADYMPLFLHNSADPDLRVLRGYGPFDELVRGR